MKKETSETKKESEGKKRDVIHPSDPNILRFLRNFAKRILRIVQNFAKKILRIV
ncbi:MAG: hypothetical protein LUC18_05490 [Porphyromonadaceae bacterium]|nr:hypothetical protein [Porphyromonadaceae bacterium]